MDQLKFNEKDHSYTLNGLILSGVTNTIKSAGLIDTRFFDEYNRQKGSVVHATTALYDRDDLANYDPAIEGFLNAWIKFKYDTGFVPVEIEQPVYSKKYMFAGCPDRIGSFPNVKGVDVVEIKTSETILPAYEIQTSAYEFAFNEMNPKAKISRRLIVQILNDGNYKITPCKNKQDFLVFLSCLNIHNFKKNHNIK